MFKAILYEKSNGECPVERFAEELDLKQKAKLYAVIRRIEEQGNHTRLPLTRYLEDGILEARVQVGNDYIRVLFFFYGKEQIILTNGFMKKTQRTPRKYIALAKSYQKDFVLRMENNDENV